MYWPLFLFSFALASSCFSSSSTVFVCPFVSALEAPSSVFGTSSWGLSFSVCTIGLGAAAVGGAGDLLTGAKIDPQEQVSQTVPSSK